MPAVLSNNAVSRLASSLTSGATSLSVTTGEGAKFPTLSGGQWFPVTLLTSAGALEIVRCTARSGDVLTIARAQEGTAARAFSAGDRVELRATEAVFADMAAATATAKAAADNAQNSANTAQAGADLAVKKDAATATGAAIIPVGTSAQRPASPVSGMLRYNADFLDFDRYQGGKWLPLNVMDKAFNEAPPVTLASAAAVNIGAALANTVNISGTTTITAFDTIAAGAIRRLNFLGALTLTHNATSLILPNGVNITTRAGDVAEFLSLGGGNWRCLKYSERKFVSAEQTITAGGALTIAHGLGVKPEQVGFYLVCTIATGNWSVGDEIFIRLDFEQSSASVTTFGFTCKRDATNLVIRFAANGIFMIDANNGGYITTGNTNFKIVFEARA
jgi:hypothetical protein